MNETYMSQRDTNPNENNPPQFPPFPEQNHFGTGSKGGEGGFSGENKITEVFKGLKKSGKKAFIPYITAGDPDLERTMDALAIFAENGADVIELGVPFSDPVADGPVIQRAMERALKSGTTLRKVLQTVKDFKNRHTVPIVLMGYFNPFWAYRIEAFAKDAREAGVDAVLTVDLPPEEAKIFTGLLKKQGIASIFLLTPVSDAKRIRIVKRVAGGFVYFVSVTGVTGERNVLPEGIKEKMQEIKNTIQLPLVLGFGISSPDTIREFYSYVDGFVVGSALIKRWEESDFLFEETSGLYAFYQSLERVCHIG